MIGVCLQILCVTSILIIIFILFSTLADFYLDIFSRFYINYNKNKENSSIFLKKVESLSLKNSNSKYFNKKEENLPIDEEFIE
jgi:hypothetical protein